MRLHRLALAAPLAASIFLQGCNEQVVQRSLRESQTGADLPPLYTPPAGGPGATAPLAWSALSYVKAPNAGVQDAFGTSLSLSGDTLVVGASGEDSNQTTITNAPGAVVDNNLAFQAAGAAYVFRRAGGAWAFEAYLKPPNIEAGDGFGRDVAISGDTIVAGASGEDSSQNTVTNSPGPVVDNNGALSAGAAYVFKRTGATWALEAYLKAPNPEANDGFGSVVAISGDAIVVAANSEDGNQTAVINAPATITDNDAAQQAGAAYVFRRTGATWAFEAYLKASNAGGSDFFGRSVGISGDTIVVGATDEDSNQNSVTNASAGTVADNNLASAAGSAYVFRKVGANWVQEAYLKASNSAQDDRFGSTVAILGDAIVVGATFEASDQNTVSHGAIADNNNAVNAGAAYVFRRSGVNWAQEAYLKASNARAESYFGDAVAIGADVIAVGARLESSSGAPADTSAAAAGSAYVFRRTAGLWAQEAYLKAPNAETDDNFGTSIAVSGDLIAVGAFREASASTTVINPPNALPIAANDDDTAALAGAVYVFGRQ